jgi:hypothetical protein
VFGGGQRLPVVACYHKTVRRQKSVLVQLHVLRFGADATAVEVRGNERENGYGLVWENLVVPSFENSKN